LIDTRLFPGYADRLRQLGALDDLNSEDAQQVAAVIICDQMRVGPHGWTEGPRDPREVQAALQQRAANVATGCDVRRWHDRGAVSNALAAAADALAASCAKSSA
jgi:hypothetical protein